MKKTCEVCPHLVSPEEANKRYSNATGEENIEPLIKIYQNFFGSFLFCGLANPEYPHIYHFEF